MPANFKNHTLLLLAICMSFCCASKPKIKSQKKICYEYSDDGRGILKIDTTVLQYDTSGFVIFPYKEEHRRKFAYEISSVILDSTSSVVKKKIMLSNDSIVYSVKNIYKDSDIIYDISLLGDTILRVKNYYHNKKLYMIVSVNYYKGIHSFNYTTRIKANNFFKLKKLYNDGFEQNGISVYFKLFRIRKEYAFNEFTGKWYVATKLKFDRKHFMIKQVTRSYNDTWKAYYTGVIKYRYNSNGDEIYEIEKFAYRKRHKKTIYSYEYY